MRKRFYILAYISICLLDSSICYAQQSKIDSLQSLLKKDKEDTNKVNHLGAIAWEYKFKAPDSSIKYGTLSLKLSQKVKWQVGIGNSYHYLGEFNWRQGNSSLSLANYKQALAIWDSLEKNIEPNRKAFITNLKASTLSNIGVVNRNQGDYPKALDYDFKALKTYEELQDKHGIAVIIGNIGLIYYNQGDYQKALDYYFKSLKKGEELGDKTLIATPLGNIGIVYNDQAINSKSQTEGDSLFNKALEYYLKSLKMKEELGNKKGIGNTLGNIGSMYADEAQKIKEDKSAKKELLEQKALEYDFKALKIGEELGDKNRITIQFGNIGAVYTDSKKYAEAEKYLLQALAIDTTIGFLNHAKDTHEQLSKLYSQTNRYQLALEHFKKAMTLKDSLFNADKNKEITRKEMNYEFEKKEASAAAVAEKEKAVASAEAQKQRVVLILVSCFLILVVAFAGFILRALRITQKQKH